MGSVVVYRRVGGGGTGARYRVSDGTRDVETLELDDAGHPTRPPTTPAGKRAVGAILIDRDRQDGWPVHGSRQS